MSHKKIIFPNGHLPAFNIFNNGFSSVNSNILCTVINSLISFPSMKFWLHLFLSCVSDFLCLNLFSVRIISAVINLHWTLGISKFDFWCFRLQNSNCVIFIRTDCDFPFKQIFEQNIYPLSLLLHSCRKNDRFSSTTENSLASLNWSVLAETSVRTKYFISRLKSDSFLIKKFCNTSSFCCSSENRFSLIPL